MKIENYHHYLEDSNVKHLFSTKNERIKAAINKSFDFLREELKKDFEPKAKQDSDKATILLDYYKLNSEEDKLVFLFEKATEGYAEIQHMVADIFYDRKEYEINNETIVFKQCRGVSAMWEFLSAINGYSYAQYKFPNCACYSRGNYDSIGFDFDDGFKLMELSANQGFINACFIVAETYFGINAKEYEKHLINIKKGIEIAKKLKANGYHDFDELIDKYLTTGSIG